RAGSAAIKIADIGGDEAVDARAQSAESDGRAPVLVESLLTNSVDGIVEERNRTGRNSGRRYSMRRQSHGRSNHRRSRHVERGEGFERGSDCAERAIRGLPGLATAHFVECIGISAVIGAHCQAVKPRKGKRASACILERTKIVSTTE